MKDLRDQIIEAIGCGTGWEESAVILYDKHIAPFIETLRTENAGLQENCDSLAKLEHTASMAIEILSSQLALAMAALEELKQTTPMVIQRKFIEGNLEAIKKLEREYVT